MTHGPGAPAVTTTTMNTTTQGLHRSITEWFVREARDLPWREPSCSPWAILVSEVMLQQTPVIRVLPVWREWMERWPSPAGLAAEPSGAAVRHWGRLGYPRRALRLHAAATAVVEEHEGAVPTTFDELLTLPGVGSYTAAAVAAFAFGRHETVVDTNIRRVHARLFGGRALPAPTVTAAEMRRAESLLPDDDALSVQWNAAVMELGAIICTARSPLCDACPVLAHCAWIAGGRPAPDHVPKGQAWAGTDRQVRGALVAVLREADDPVPRSILLGAPVDFSMNPAAVTGSPDEAGPCGPVRGALSTLHGLQAPADQLERALAGILTDGLAEETDGAIHLPH